MPFFSIECNWLLSLCYCKPLYQTKIILFLVKPSKASCLRPLKGCKIMDHFPIFFPYVYKIKLIKSWPKWNFPDRTLFVQNEHCFYFILYIILFPNSVCAPYLDFFLIQEEHGDNYHLNVIWKVHGLIIWQTLQIFSESVDKNSWKYLFPSLFCRINTNFSQHLPSTWIYIK